MPKWCQMDEFFEMGMQKHALISRIRFHYPEIHEQCIKIYMFPKSKNIPHWVSQLYGYLKSIHYVLKSTNKYPDANTYYRYLTEGLNDHSYYKNLKQWIEHKYKSYLSKDDSRKFPEEIKFEALIRIFMTDLSILLSEDDDLYDKLVIFVNRSIIR